MLRGIWGWALPGSLRKCWRYYEIALASCPVNYLPLLGWLWLGDLSLTLPEAGNTSLCVGCLFRLTETITMASFERFFVTPFSQLPLADKLRIKHEGRPTPSLKGIRQKHTLGGKRSARFCLYLLFLCLLTETSVVCSVISFLLLAY